MAACRKRGECASPITPGTFELLAEFTEDGRGARADPIRIIEAATRHPSPITHTRHPSPVTHQALRQAFASRMQACCGADQYIVTEPADTWIENWAPPITSAWMHYQ